jgi:hypothetical protein
MKNLFRVFSCLIIAAATAMGQQGSQSKPKPSALQQTGDVLVKALLAADSAQSKKESSSAEALKKTIDQEIAKTVVSSFAWSTQIPTRRILKPEDRVSILTANDLMVLINGAVYYRFDGTIYPMPGGGASGCFDPNVDERVQKARMKFVEQSQAAQKKEIEEKKD